MQGVEHRVIGQKTHRGQHKNCVRHKLPSARKSLSTVRSQKLKPLRLHVQCATCRSYVGICQPQGQRTCPCIWAAVMKAKRAGLKPDH